MAAVLEFRPQSVRPSAMPSRLRPEVGKDGCEIVIFPGVRRQRHLEQPHDAGQSTSATRGEPGDWR